jgi:chemotaxis phosphatase CheX-like protein
VKLVELLEVAAVSAREIASGPLGAQDLRWLGAASTPLPRELFGVYIPLLMDGLALQLGVLATRDVCARLARALVGGLDMPIESDADILDAVGEVTNLIAGNLKVALADRVDVRVGVPLAMKGRVFQLGGSQSIHGTLTVDRSDVWLVMTGTRTD